MEKLLEGHLKLPAVISDIHGKSGRDMLDALAAGQHDPKVLAQMARWRRWLGQLHRAWTCRPPGAGSCLQD